MFMCINSRDNYLYKNLVPPLVHNQWQGWNPRWNKFSSVPLFYVYFILFILWYFWSGPKSWETLPPCSYTPDIACSISLLNTLVAHWKAKLFPLFIATIQHFLIFICGNQNIILVPLPIVCLSRIAILVSIQNSTQLVVWC